MSGTSSARPTRAPLAFFAHPSAELYGSDRVLLESITALHSSGYRVVLSLPESGPLVDAATQRGARVVVTPTPVLRKSLLRPRGLCGLAARTPGRVLAHRALIRRLRPDVVVVNTLTIPAWLIAARLARVATVCHVHEAERSAAPLVRRALNAPLALAHRVITNSVFSRETILESAPRLASRTTVVYNGVPGPAHPVEPRRTLTRAPLRLAFLGRLSERKGATVAVDALIALRGAGVDAHLTMIGDVFPGYEWFRDGLRTRIAAAGMSDHVTETGFITPVWPELAAADIVLIPSLADEPFGNTAVEAVLAARPTIVSNTSGLREAGGVFSSVLRVTPGSAPALAEAIGQLAADWPAARTRAIESARDAEQRYGVAQYHRAFRAEVADALHTTRLTGDHHHRSQPPGTTTAGSAPAPADSTTPFTDHAGQATRQTPPV